MCTSWAVPATKRTDEITLNMPTLDTLRLAQGDGSITVTTDQLRALLNTLFWLDEICHANLQEALAHLSENGTAAKPSSEEHGEFA